LCEISDSLPCALFHGAQNGAAQIRARIGCDFVKRLLPFLVFLGVASVVALGVYALAYRANLNQLQRTGNVQLEQAADRLLGQLESFQQLPNLLVRHPIVVGALNGAISVDAANAYLVNTALTVGAEEILVLDRQGLVVAASNFEDPFSAVGQNLAGANYVQRALKGGLGYDHAFEPRDRGRDFFFARGVIDGQAPPVGVVVVRADVAQLEFEWEVDEAVLVFEDEFDVVFVTNRVELVLTRDGADGMREEAARLFPRGEVKPFAKYARSDWFGAPIFNFGAGSVMPERALVLSEFIPRLGLTAKLFLDTKTAAANARISAYLAVALLALIGAVLVALNQRRRRLSDRLQVEAQANARLEARVEERTAQLRAAQDQLVQAGKLTALGQMSAGISHEVNQPLAAIRNFAANSVKLIERDRLAEASENLGMITQQVERINRIIKNLRGFARNEVEVPEPVDLNVVLGDAIRLTEQRLRDGDVMLENTPIAGPLMVMGGPVRLQQVLVNLIGNAVDAMADAPQKVLRLWVENGGEVVRIFVADTGTGLREPGRVFEPFYTTKDVGASKGLGLGLSISFGIIGSFGGTLSCRNLDKGAEFCVELRAAP
jgi:two-component system C4-dicarboxylate transport sensor histidine kinase DctB